MEIAGVVGMKTQTNVGTTDTYVRQQTYAQPASQPQFQQNPETPAKAQSGTSNNDSVKVTITNAGKEMLNSSQQNAKEAGGDTINTLTNLAQGDTTQPGTQSTTDAKDKKQENTPPPPENSLFSNSAYYSVQKNSEDNTQTVVVKIVDSEGNVVREIPPEDLLTRASKLNIIPNNLYHAVG
ncbi:MAG: flagellar protein FlaG [Nitrospirota bacterium]